MGKIASRLDRVYCMNSGKLHKDNRPATWRVMGGKEDRTLYLCESCLRELEKGCDLTRAKVLKFSPESYSIVPGYSNRPPKKVKASKKWAGTKPWEKKRDLYLKKLQEELDALLYEPGEEDDVDPVLLTN